MFVSSCDTILWELPNSLYQAVKSFDGENSVGSEADVVVNYERELIQTVLGQ